MPEDSPSPFDSLAALNKLSNTAECDTAFYTRYQSSFDMAAGFIGFLGSHHPDLATLFIFTGAPLKDISHALRDFLSSTPLPSLNLEWVDAEMTLVMQHVLPIFRDPALPPFLEECRWPIEGAFA